MKVADFAAPEAFLKFTEEMERASRRMQEAALRLAVPSSSGLAELTAKFLVPEEQLRKMLKLTVMPNARLEALLPWVTSPVLNSQRILEETIAASEIMRNFYRGCGIGAARLARSGWTLPISMSLPEMLELIRMADDDAIDIAFVAAYHGDGGLASLRDDLLAAARLKDWQPLLAECLDNYEEGRHRICIPALLSVLEGAIARPDGVEFVRTDQRIAYFRAKIEAAGRDSLDYATWSSMDIFFALLYEKRDFVQDRPPMLNRHWILHSRDLPASWRQADALRLFHALATLCSLYGEL